MKKMSIIALFFVIILQLSPALSYNIGVDTAAISAPGPNPNTNVPTQLPVTVIPGTFPTSVSYQNQVYVVYMGSQATINGIPVVFLYMIIWTGSSWTAPVIIPNGCTAAPNTSPSAVATGGVIRIYFNGSGNDGTWETSYTPATGAWAPYPSQIKVAGNQAFVRGTSPTATVDDSGNIWVFNVQAANSGAVIAQCIKAANAQSFNSTIINLTGQGVYIATGTSPSAVWFSDAIFFFYNGMGNNGVFFTTHTSNGNWNFNIQVPGSSFQVGTSPSAYSINEKELVVLTTQSASQQSYSVVSVYQSKPVAITNAANTIVTASGLAYILGF